MKMIAADTLAFLPMIAIASIEASQVFMSECNEDDG